jgi:hypothetical protein
MQKYLGRYIQSKFGPLLAGFGGVSKFLKKALLIIFLIASVGGGLSTVSVQGVDGVTPGFKITGREALSTNDDVCASTSSDDGGASKLLWLGLSGTENKELLGGCVYGKLGNGYGQNNNPEAKVKLTGCEFALKNNGRDLFCSGAADLVNGVEYAATHWKFTSAACSKGIPTNEDKHFCTDKQQGKAQQCYGSARNSFTICDSNENGERPTVGLKSNGTKTFTDNGWSCEVNGKSDGNLNRTQYTDWKCVSPGGTVVDSAEEENVCMIFNYDGQYEPTLNCKPGDLVFSNGTRKIWKNNDNTQAIQKPDNSFVRLSFKDMNAICKFGLTDDLQIINYAEICKKITKEEFFGAVKADCEKQKEKNPGVQCDSKPGQIAERDTVSNSAQSLTNAQDKAKAAGGNALGGLFSFLYKIVLVILLIVLILIEYLQLIVLTIMSYIISALLDLSPTAPILTKIGLPLWQIFANLANFLVVGFMVYVGAATMVGLRKTEQAGKDIVTISVLALLLNTTYFFLNFIISTMDGFAKLLVAVFVGKGGLFGLFTGMFGLFSKVSVIRDGQGAINVDNPFSVVSSFGNTVTSTIGKVGEQFGQDESALTFTFLGEALVVVSFFIILLIFKDTFVLVFARITILLLLLITSPVWVVAYFLKDIFKSSSIASSISKLPSQLFGTIVFNFAMVLGVIITVLITGAAQDGFKGYILDVGNNGGNAAAGTTANFLSPTGASLVIAGVVPVFLGVATLYFINKSFVGLFPLLDKLGTQLGNGATDFAKGVISGDVKGGITKFAKGATTLATGGGQLENIATTAPKLAVKGGVMGVGLGAGIGDVLTGGRLKLSQKVANFEEQRLRPFLKEGGVTETIAGAVGNRIGKDSTIQQIATKRAEYIDAEKKKKRENAIGKGLTEAERDWNKGAGRGIVSDNAKSKEDLDNAQGQTSAEKGGIENTAKDQYYNSTAGQDALKARVLAEQNLEQLKTIADNLKSGQESTAKSQFYSDPRNNTLIERATELKTMVGIQKETDESDINKQQAITESIINAEPQVKAAYSKLTDSQFGIASTPGGLRTGGSFAAQNRASEVLSTAQGDYKTAKETYEFDKEEKDRIKKETTKTNVIKEGRNLYRSSTTPPTNPAEKRKFDLYVDSKESWEITKSDLLSKRNAATDPSSIALLDKLITQHDAKDPDLIP